MDMQDVDFGLSRELRWRTFRRRVAALALVVGALEYVGAPALRVTSPDASGPASYFTVEGALELPWNNPKPLIIMVPLDRSVVARAGDVIAAIRAEWFRG